MLNQNKINKFILKTLEIILHNQLCNQELDRALPKILDWLNGNW